MFVISRWSLFAICGFVLSKKESSSFSSKIFPEGVLNLSGVWNSICHCCRYKNPICSIDLISFSIFSFVMVSRFVIFFLVGYHFYLLL